MIVPDMQSARRAVLILFSSLRCSASIAVMSQVPMSTMVRLAALKLAEIEQSIAPIIRAKGMEPNI